MSDNSNMSNYESLVQRNIEENKRMLISLGLLQEKCHLKKTKPPSERSQSTTRPKHSLSGNLPIEGQRRIKTRRFSLRSNLVFPHSVVAQSQQQLVNLFLNLGGNATAFNESGSELYNLDPLNDSCFFQVSLVWRCYYIVIGAKIVRVIDLPDLEKVDFFTKRTVLRMYIDGNESNDEDIGEEENYTPQRKPKVIREQTFGEIAGVSVGDWWPTRMECSNAGVHRPTVAGIHGKADDGCYSIALSGGYEDDLDCGEYFTYTGSGGRDLKGTKLKPKNLRTAPQSRDQVLEGINAALALNIETRKPVRVIRGYKLQSQFAPEEGYRYDGLYSVEKCWSATGLSGFKVCKYALKRLPFQDPPPWNALFLTDNTSSTIHMPNGRFSEEINMNGVNQELSVGGLNAVLSENLSNNEHSPQSENQKPFDMNTVLTPKSQNVKTNTSEASPVRLNDDNGFKGFPSSSPPDTLHSNNSSAESSVSDSMKQLSILKYFHRQTKSTKPTPINRVSNTVNPKALRNNRFTSLWTFQPETNASKKRQSAPVKHSDTSRVSNDSCDTTQKPSVSDDSSETRKENLIEPRVVVSENTMDDRNLSDNAADSPPIRQCFVKLMQDDCFMGWDCFHGFDDDK